MEACIGSTKTNYSNWYRPIGSADYKLTYCEFCAKKNCIKVPLEKIEETLTNYKCDCSQFNLHKVIKGYVCPKCIEEELLTNVCNFCCTGSCTSCAREVSYSSLKYCDRCSIEKIACHKCGNPISDGEESIKQVKDFFESSWFDKDCGNNAYLFYEYGFCEYKEIDTSLSTEERKDKAYHEILEGVNAKYSGKTQEEVLKMIYGK